MLLAIDVGNTKIKAAVFKDNGLLEKYIFDKDNALKNFQKIFEEQSQISEIIFSSVGKMDEAVIGWLGKKANLHIISHNSLFPFTNRYATPTTLGIDRMVLSAGAVLSLPDSNRMVIDAGTCITYDFTDAGNNYLGGAISPGLQLRYAALHNFTAKLPLLSPELPVNYIGNSTNQAIHSGLVNGLLHEVEGFITQYSEQYQDLKIILTGGDAEFLAKRLKNTIFANSNFLLESLNYLYSYTIKND